MNKNPRLQTTYKKRKSQRLKDKASVVKHQHPWNRSEVYWNYWYYLCNPFEKSKLFQKKKVKKKNKSALNLIQIDNY